MHREKEKRDEYDQKRFMEGVSKGLMIKKEAAKMAVKSQDQEYKKFRKSNLLEKVSKIAKKKKEKEDREGRKLGESWS